MLEDYFAPSGVGVELVDAHGIIKEKALDEKVLAFFLGGGRSTPYREKLRHQGDDKIKEYVQNGGIYFGVCAGAYYSCKRTEFESDIPASCIETNETLGLLDATAKGTLYKEYGIKPYAISANSATVSRIKWLPDNEEHAAHYHGGCYFNAYENGNVEVLAVYDDIGESKPAIVKGKYGDGLVIASGVHFETLGADLAKAICSLQADETVARRNASSLIENEPKRKALELKLLGMLKARR
jgi:glutamine amidotransferase-like uncharacterized protein